MSNIGILSGGGKLPLIIGEKLRKKSYNIIYFCIEPFANVSNYKNLNFARIKLNSLTKIIQQLKKYNVDSIIMAGYVVRPSLKDIHFDFNTIKLIKNYTLDAKGDDKLLSSISILFQKNGFPTFDWKFICKDLFSDKNLFTKIKPSIKALNNKRIGMEIFKKVGLIDLTQSLIIQNKIVLGIEAAEGTDELIKRCSNYKKKEIKVF